MSNALLTDIRAFLARTGMSPYRFGLLAVRNGRLVERLESGGRIWPETEQAVREYMASGASVSPGGSRRIEPLTVSCPADSVNHNSAEVKPE